MSWLHNRGKRVAPIHVDNLLSHFILKILNNSSASFANGLCGHLNRRFFL